MHALAIAIALATLAFASGCDNATSARPTDPQYGVAECARCGSVIADPRFAAQYRLAGGTVKLFDDPGCLVAALADEKTEVDAIHFHDHGSETWLAAGDASFAHTPRTQSPRGYGWAAYGSFGAAQEAVTSAGGGDLLGWDQARGRILKSVEEAGR